MRAQAGQAMVELIIASGFLLVPLLFMITYLGKVGDIKHRTYESARYSVWEMAKTKKTTSQIRREVDHRILYSANPDLDSLNDRQGGELSVENVDRLYWHTDDLGKYGLYLASAANGLNNVTKKKQRPSSNSYKNRDKTIDLYGFELSKSGVISATSSIDTIKTRHLSVENAISVSSKNTMFVDSWREVSHDGLAYALGESIVVQTQKFDELRKIVGGIADLFSTFGFQEFGELDLGHVEFDAVSCSRVSDGGGDREAACL